VTVKKGDRFRWHEVHVEVLRVARDGSWADIYCNANPDSAATGWTKRQPLPFPADMKAVAS
jgi:hypothetical protein